MIGKVVIGKSFRGCLKYCLEDKIADEKKNEIVMKDRAEIISYNQCFGNAKDLTKQFNEVRQLNSKVSKPVLHITLSLAKGENLPGYKLAEIARDCADDLGFSNNQFVAVVHKDTEHPHIHIIANRIGYDGKTVSDSNNYQKIARLCRKMELKYELKQVLSPNVFLPKELRDYKRLDQRKEVLKKHIQASLASSKNYEQFERKMKALKYEVIRMRGIAFRDQQKVYMKGSEVGYSLAIIQKVLTQRQDIKLEPAQLTKSNPPYEKLPGKSFKTENEEQLPKENQSILDALLKPNPELFEGVNHSLLQEQRRRRKKHKHRHL